MVSEVTDSTDGGSLANVEEARNRLAFRPLLAASDILRWTAVAVDVCRGYLIEDYCIGEVHEPALDHHVIGIPLGNSPLLYQERCGQRFKGPLLAGQATIIPAGYRARWRGRFPDFVALRVSPNQLAEAAAEHGRIGRSPTDLASCFAVRDPALHCIGQLFAMELHRPAHPTQSLMIQSLATTLSVHLLRSYTIVGSERKFAISPNSAPIRRALDYIDDHPHHAISLAELAAVSGLSRFHFSREFKRRVGMTPVCYVERSRIERAKGLMERNELSLAEIALAVGFADQSHFTRRFRHHVGCTPGVFSHEQVRGRGHPPDAP